MRKLNCKFVLMKNAIAKHECTVDYSHAAVVHKRQLTRSLILLLMSDSFESFLTKRKIIIKEKDDRVKWIRIPDLITTFCSSLFLLLYRYIIPFIFISTSHHDFSSSCAFFVIVVISFFSFFASYISKLKKFSNSWADK